MWTWVFEKKHFFFQVDWSAFWKQVNFDLLHSLTLRIVVPLVSVAEAPSTSKVDLWGAFYQSSIRISISIFARFLYVINIWNAKSFAENLVFPAKKWSNCDLFETRSRPRRVGLVLASCWGCLHLASPSSQVIHSGTKLKETNLLTRGLFSLFFFFVLCVGCFYLYCFNYLFYLFYFLCLSYM